MRLRLVVLRHLGLRNRVAAGFALMGLVLSTALALAAWFFVSSYLEHEGEDSAVAQTVDSGEFLQLQLSSGKQPGQGLVDQLRYPADTTALLFFGNHTYSNLAGDPPDLPGRLVRDVASGATRTERVSVGGTEYLAVGVPLDGGAAFFELHPLSELRSTLRVLGTTLLAGAIGTTLMGLALGMVASRRLIRPVERVTETAAAIAQGDLSARIDVDERQDPDLLELAESFNRTAEALERRVRADARFAGDVSHELRTPLTTMLNSLALVETRRDVLPAEVLEPLELLREDMDRFSQMVLDLLEISKDDGGDTGTRERVLVADLVRLVADNAVGRPVTVVEAAAGDAHVAADKRRLESVVANLVHNAEDHGGGCTAVRVAVAGPHVRIEVEDHGPGIPAEWQQRVFDRFARGTDGGGGVGLGLAIVARHAEWHGGTASVEDAPGGGARFVVSLPRLP